MVAEPIYPHLVVAWISSNVEAIWLGPDWGCGAGAAPVLTTDGRHHRATRSRTDVNVWLWWRLIVNRTVDGSFKYHNKVVSWTKDVFEHTYIRRILVVVVTPRCCWFLSVVGRCLSLLCFEFVVVVVCWPVLNIWYG